MKQPAGAYPHVCVQDDGRAVVSQAGSVLLVETVRKTGLDQAPAVHTDRHDTPGSGHAAG